MNLILVFLLFLTVRLASVFIVQTFYVPDEYWQSLEVAHKITFGYGHLTWEWTHGIRSYFYPAIIAGIYKILALLDLDTVDLLIIVPRIFQAIISTISDYRFYIWCGKKKWSIFLVITSYFWFYIASRTLANTLETALTTIALSYYPWKKENSKYLWFALLCCYIRPTAAIIWIPLCLCHLINSRHSIWKLLFTRFLLIGLIVFGSCIAIDAYFYKRFIITPIEFLKYNFLQGIGSFYGTHPWHWYFTAGLPTVLGVDTIPFLVAFTQTIRNKETYPIKKVLLSVIMFTLIVLSFVEHKEFRFILCLLPMCLYIISDTLVKWSRNASKFCVWVVAIVLLIGNASPMWYLSIVHQRGSLDLMTHLSKIAREYKTENNQKASIYFLMPCHSTPYYSHIHQNVTMRFLTCEPNLNQQKNYIDEADQFYMNPSQWLRSHLPIYPKSALPSHIVLYEPLSKKISDFLVDYDVIQRVFHAEHVTNRTGQFILIYEKHKNNEDNMVNQWNEQIEDKIDNDYSKLEQRLDDEL